MHRIREAMHEGKLPDGTGGVNKVVEIYETCVSGKEARLCPGTRTAARWRRLAIPN